jgi:hypothetical protein
VGWSLLDAASCFVEELVDAEQGLQDGHRGVLVLVDLTVVAGEVFQRLAAADDLKISFGQPLLLVVFQQILQGAHVAQHLAAQLGPGDGPRRLVALAANVDDIVFDLLSAERSGFASFTLGFVRPNRISSLQIKARVEKTFKYRNPWSVFVVVKSESKNAGGL